MRAGGDVEEHHFISALPIIQRQLHRITNTQFTGPPCLHATRHLSVMDIKTRNDTFG